MEMRLENLYSDDSTIEKPLSKDNLGQLGLTTNPMNKLSVKESVEGSVLF